MSLTQLPTPRPAIPPALHGSADRWQPVRAGVVNVWQYANETLEFADGRLLLFGANGSGKTMLLELLLPYLLDAKGQPGRLSTSGADRGGLWDRVVGYESGSGRTGYLWITFARPDGDDTAHFTCGTRLRAKPSGGGEHTWFTTSLAPGVDLHLLDGDRRPLDVDALTEALGDHGTVWHKNTDGYRDTVRQTLFPGFTALHLEALIQSLLVVRKQSVTDGLSADKLNELLTAGLPPLDDDEVAKLARGFEELDRRREQIATLTADVEAVRALAEAARRYARATVAAHADDRVAAETTKDTVTRAAREAEEALKDALQTQQQITDELTRIADGKVAVDAELDALRNSEAYRAASTLQALREQAEQSAGHADRLEQRADVDRATAARLATEADGLAGQRELADGQLASAVAELTGTATDAGIELDQDIDADALAAHARAQVDALRGALRQVRAALQAFSGAVAVRDGSAEAAATAEDRWHKARTALTAAADAADQALDDWRGQVAGWCAGLAVLDVGAVTEAIAGTDDPDVVATAAQRAYEAVAEQVAAATAQLRHERDQLQSDDEQFAAEITRLQDGGHDQPDVPDGRRDRTGLPGAPLWQLVDFAAPDGPGHDRLEAALAEAGLLDAWVAPDGTVTLDGPDVALSLDAPAVDGPTLRRALVPEPDGPVGRAVVADLLDRVGWGPTALEAGPPVAIGADGTYRAGPLRGRARPVGSARFIGATTRERHRLARIGQLQDRRAELAQQMAEIDRRSRDQDTRRDTAAAERDAADVPARADLLAARHDEQLAVNRVEVTAAAVEDATEALGLAEQAVRDAQRQLAVVAGRHRLPTEADALDAREEAYGRVASQAATVETRADRADSAAAAAERAATQVAEAAEVAEASAADAVEARRQANGHTARHRTLEEVSGAPARQVQADIAAAERRRDRLAAQDKDARARQRQVDEQVGGAQIVQQDAEQDRLDAESARDAAHQRFRDVVAAGLAVDAGWELDGPLETVTASREAAQAVRAAAEQVTRTPKATARALSRLEERLHVAATQLSGRADLAVIPAESGAYSTLDARVDGVAHRAPLLHDTFERRLVAATDELTAAEEEVFEQTLTGAVRDHLAARIRTATGTVAAVNELLGHVRTAAGGVKVQLRWDVDGDEVDDAAVLRRVRTLLLGSRHDADETTELHTFLRRQIDQVRAADGDTGSWQDRLATVLDYRRWHRFTVLVHHDRFADRPVPFGSRKVTLSAGEKTVALTVPLIAAIAAHYLPRDGQQEPPPCPRLLLMDELFPKVDRPNKRLLLELINDLGLDVVFTSDKDWCDYDTLDTIAIHVVQKDGDTSLTTRFVWNGAGRSPAPVSTDEPDGTLLGLLDDGDGA